MNEMFDNAIKEAMKWLEKRNDAIFPIEENYANFMANYWLGYAAGISQVMKLTEKCDCGISKGEE